MNVHSEFPGDTGSSGVKIPSQTHIPRSQVLQPLPLDTVSSHSLLPAQVIGSAELGKLEKLLAKNIRKNVIKILASTNVCSEGSEKMRTFRNAL
jgi:hypothetical protein